MMTIVLTDDQYNGLVLLLERIAIGVERQSNPPPKKEPFQNYGLNPCAKYTDGDLQIICGVGEKTTRRWRQKYGLKYHQGVFGKSGSPIWYLGQYIIDFLNKHAVELRINEVKPVFKEIPQGKP